MRVVQITDTHLMADPAATVVGVKVDRTFAAVIAAVKQAQEPIDLVLATGDLAHDAEARTYQRFSSQIKTLGAPVLCLPGNHDDPGMLAAELGGGPCHAVRLLERGGWRFVTLNSRVAGIDAGRLGDEELDALAHALRATQGEPTAICLHHHPIDTDAMWMNETTLADADRLFAEIRGHDHVRVVVFGHVHREITAERNGLLLLGAPSTCHQFKPSTVEPAFDALRPGYRRLDLHPDGTIDTAICRIST